MAWMWSFWKYHIVLNGQHGEAGQNDDLCPKQGIAGQHKASSHYSEQCTI